MTNSSFKLRDLPYERLDIETVRSVYRSLMERLLSAPTFERQEKVHQDYYRFSEHLGTIIALANIRRDADLTDEFYKEEAAFYDEIGPEIASLDTQYHKLLLKSPFRTRWKRKTGEISFINMELSERSHSERIIPLMRKENALVADYERLIASNGIPFKGRIYSLSGMSRFITDPDRAVRAHAWKAIDTYFTALTGELDEIFDRLVKCRTAQAKAMGFASFVEMGYMRMHRSCYSRKEIEMLRGEIKEHIVPLCSSINRKRQARLTVPDLSLIDQLVYFKDGNPVPTGTSFEILEKGRQLYHKISPVTGEFFDYMQEHELFDVQSRKTKKAAGYMTYLGDYKAPFIFANFNGTNEDIDVITHECGHAFQGYLLRNEPVREAAQMSMDIAEIHSMSMEYFTSAWMEPFFGDRTEDYRIMHLEDAILFLPYGCMVDEFQHIIYDKPFMSPKERKMVWQRLEAKYRPHIDFDGMPFFAGGGYWQMQHHIFSSPFYYIDYVLASLCAMQYKIMMDEDFERAFDSYLELCEMSGRYSFTETIERAGLRVPFEAGVIKDIAANIYT